MKLEGTKFEQYANWQVSQLRSGDHDFWERLSEDEYQAVAPYLKNPVRILDLGCGLGRVAGHLARYIPSPPATYILADSTGAEPTWEWKAAAGYYNDLQLTAEYVQQQGIRQFEIVDLATDQLDQLRDVDLVISCLAVGFHYPITAYLQRLIHITAHDAVLAFGIRRGTLNADHLTKLSATFSGVHVIEGTTRDKITGIRIKEDMLILEK
jgi:SAM-dependent methyltransferase